MTLIPYLSVVRFSGADAVDFLHNQLSNDVLGLADGDSTFACYCEPKGRVLALMLVCRKEDTCYAVLARSLAEAVTSRLRMYVMRAKVEIEILEQHAVAGHGGGTIANAQEVAAVIPVPGADRSLLVMDAKMIDPAGDDAVNAWKTAELEQAITWLNPETSGQFLPQWLGFDELGAVNFRKGCYPGQEIVARTKYLGKVKRRPHLLHIAREFHPEPMEKLNLTSGDQSDKAVVVDSVKIDSGTSLLVVTRLDPDANIDSVKCGEQELRLG